MKKTTSVIWGTVLVALGLIFALNALEITDIDVFFDGWWTLFIIVPCAVGLFTEREKTGNLIGLGVGVALLLACQDVIKFSIVRKLIIPAIIIALGVGLIHKNVFDKHVKQKINMLNAFHHANDESYWATFSGNYVDFTGRNFTRADLNAIFGGIKCDLRNATINEDAVINICCVFGGVDILVPDNVTVKRSATCVFGGMSDKRIVKNKDASVTLYVSGLCLFGGTDIK